MRHGHALRVARIERITDNAKEISCSLPGCPRESYVSGKVHVLVAGGNARSTAKACASHVWSGGLPGGSFYVLGDEIYLSTPEFLFLQMAGKFSISRLAAFGYELCGSFAITAKRERGYETSTPPLTSAERIACYLQRAGGCYGAKKAREALAFIKDGASCPMEGPLALLIGMPRSRGGRGLDGFLLNQKLALPEGYREHLGRACLLPDLYFPEERVAVKYCGVQEHSDFGGCLFDTGRQTTLNGLRLRLVAVTKQDLYDPDRFEAFTKSLAKLLGRRYHKPTQKEYAKTLKLKDEILPGHDSLRHVGAYWF